MVSLSHRALRELILGFGGLDLAYTEMASAAAAASGSIYEKWYLDADPEPEKTILQFYLTGPERLDEAIGLVAGKPVFGIDLNFGCSAPNILRAGGGAAWMHKPEAAAALAAQARAAWPRPRSLSAKLRIGEEEDYGALLAFCRGLVGAGVDFLTLHPRLESEKFRRKSRWDYVARLSRDLPIPLVGNGDVKTYADWRERKEEDGPAGVMIGRGAASRPWIFALIRGKEAAPDFSLRVDLRETAFAFLDLVERRLPEDFHLTRARRFFFYYCDNFSFAHHIKWKLENAADLAAMRLLLDEYFAEVPGDRVKVETN